MLWRLVIYGKHLIHILMRNGYARSTFIFMLCAPFLVIVVRYSGYCWRVITGLFVDELCIYAHYLGASKNRFCWKSDFTTLDKF